MSTIEERLDEIKPKYKNLITSFDLRKEGERLKKLEASSTDPSLWDDPARAKSIMQEIGDLQDKIKNFNELEKNMTMVLELSKDSSYSKEVLLELSKLEKMLDKLILQSFLSGEYDHKNAIVSIHAGQGGVEAMDWSEMLHRMYLRYTEKKNWSSENVDYSQGEEAGIKSVTFKVIGNFAYGYLKNEAGTHRLVRQSPFNANNLRQTSFALVGVMPELSKDDLPQIEIKDEDLEWQFFRSSTQGGQNVQKVSTAVRLIHKPTQIAVTAQSQRFQEQNRKIALELMRAKIWMLEKERQKTKIDQIKGEYKPASWGNQIRSYVLHPYKMVKDLRTGVESSDPESVLDGELDMFIEAELKIKD